MKRGCDQDVTVNTAVSGRKNRSSCFFNFFGRAEVYPLYFVDVVQFIFNRDIAAANNSLVIKNIETPDF